MVNIAKYRENDTVKLLKQTNSYASAQLAVEGPFTKSTQVEQFGEICFLQIAKSSKTDFLPKIYTGDKTKWTTKPFPICQKAPKGPLLCKGPESRSKNAPIKTANCYFSVPPNSFASLLANAFQESCNSVAVK